MSVLPQRPPAYCRQRETGRADRAYVRIDGKKIKLGVYGSPASRQRYAELIQLWQAAAGEPVSFPSADPTVSEVLVAFLDWAESEYGTEGEYVNFKSVAKVLRRESGGVLAREFGPKLLKQTRQAMIAAEWCRNTINRQVNRIRQIFKWAVSEELIPATNLAALQAVSGLRAGRSQASESPPVDPVEQATIDATIAKLPQVVADMVQVQRLTAMRPGELVRMRPADIDRSSEVWVYQPERHKNAYRGHQRSIALGPKCQAILLRYLARAADSCCFQPRDSEEKRLAANSELRQTPLSCGNRRGSNRRRHPRTKPGAQYTVHSYRRAIHRAAKRAGVEQWSPHRLRHTAATTIRSEFGLDAAKVILGHRGVKTSEIYAELDLNKAVQVAKQIG